MENDQTAQKQQAIKQKSINIYLLVVCILITAIIAGIGGYVVGGTKRQTTPPTQTTGVMSQKLAPATPNPTQEAYHLVAIPQNKFTCRSDINSILSHNPYVAEGWDTTCYFPWQTTTPFQFKNHLECQGITDENITAGGFTQNPFTGMQVNLSKDDWIKFTLDFQGNTIARTQESIPFPEAYTIIHDTHDIVQAIRPVTEGGEIIAAHPAYHQFITFSKATGEGMEVRQDEEPGNGIDSMLFQCK